jgi:hypothetical protein
MNEEILHWQEEFTKAEQAFNATDNVYEQMFHMEMMLQANQKIKLLEGKTG